MTNRALQRNASPPRGFTFMELLLAMICTGLISVAIASMLFAVARGTSGNSDTRGLVLQQKLLTGRMDVAIRCSTKVLAQGSGYIVLWMSDSRANGGPDLSELRRIEYNSTNQTITSYRMPASWTQSQIDANDVNYLLTDDFNAKTNTVKGTTSFPAEVWSNSAYGWTMTLDNATVQSARLVSYQVVIQSGTVQTTVASAAALRN